MACNSCSSNIFKQKLGRCKTCMWSNFLLLIGCASIWLLGFQSAPKQVASIALLFAFFASAILMAAHLLAYGYYRFKGIKRPTEFVPKEGK